MPHLFQTCWTGATIYNAYIVNHVRYSCSSQVKASFEKIICFQDDVYSANRHAEENKAEAILAFYYFVRSPDYPKPLVKYCLSIWKYLAFKSHYLHLEIILKLSVNVAYLVLIQVHLKLVNVNCKKSCCDQNLVFNLGCKVLVCLIIHHQHPFNICLFTYSCKKSINILVFNFVVKAAGQW